jgi:monovalent cation/proton antiporter MnhG/PhaG subunit
MEVVGIVLVVTGTLVSVLAAWGIVDFPSSLARMHASSKSASLGLALIALGSGFAAGSWGLVGIGFLVSLFLFVTAPTAGHMLGRAALAAGHAGELIHDDLTGAGHQPLALAPPTERRFSVQRWATVVIVWMLLWRDVSFGTFVGGMLVGLLLESIRRRSEAPIRVAPVGMARFVVRYIVMVLSSNARVAWEVLTPSNELIKEAIVACPLRSTSIPANLLVANAVTFTPGTMSLELSGDPRILYVHVLHFTTPEAVRTSVSELEDLVLAAMPDKVAGR